MTIRNWNDNLCRLPIQCNCTIGGAFCNYCAILFKDIKESLNKGFYEHFWHRLLKMNPHILPEIAKILISKMPISIPNIKIPDFSMVREDGIIDILEIKRPDTPLITWRNGKFVWTNKIWNALYDVVNYKNEALAFQSQITEKVTEWVGIRTSMSTPHCFLLAGNTANFTQDQKIGYEKLKRWFLPKDCTIWNYNDLIPQGSKVRIID